MQFFILLDC